MNNVIAQAEELKRKISQAVDDIRDSATYINAIESNKDKLNLTLQGAGHTIYLEKLLSADDIADVKSVVMAKIAERQSKKEELLMNLINPSSKGPVAADEPVEATKETKEEAKEEVKEIVKPKAAVKKEVTIETKRKPVKPDKSKMTMSEDEEEAYLREHYIKLGKSAPDIAIELGVGKTWVYDRIKKYKLREEKLIANSWNIEEVKKMLKDKKTVKEIAKFYGIEKKECYKKMQEAGISPSLFQSDDR